MKKNNPVIVSDKASADTCNTKYGERYGVDWEYRGKITAKKSRKNK